MIRKLIRVAMRDTGHQVVTAEDGEAGLRLVRELRPDLLVTDLSMPVMTGLELHDAIRGDPEIDGLPVVFLTASTQRGLMAQARKRTPSAILSKPFSPAALRAELELILARVK